MGVILMVVQIHQQAYLFRDKTIVTHFLFYKSAIDRPIHIIDDLQTRFAHRRLGADAHLRLHLGLVLLLEFGYTGANGRKQRLLARGEVSETSEFFVAGEANKAAP
jgi:hypothetical protein